MKSTIRSAFAALACLAGAFFVSAPLLMAPAAHAQVVALKPFGVTALQEATVDATPAYSNATTSYTAIPGASVTIPVTNKAWAGKQFIEACYWADATKATSTTGTIQVVANGAAIPASRRSIASSAGQNNISLCYRVARASGLAQTVSLQGVSGDTAAFTIANLQFTVRVLFQN